MRVTKKHVMRDIISCNFCDKGTLNKQGYGLIYPYNYVYEFKRSNNNGIMVTICEDCLTELNNHVSQKR